MSKPADYTEAKTIFPMIMEKLPDLVGFVANGGSLIDFCKQNTMEYSKVIMWLNDTDHPSRASAYNAALEARGEFVVQAILRELQNIAMIDIREAFYNDGTMKTLDDMPVELTRVISSIEVNETFEYEGEKKVWTGYTKKMKLNDKMAALKMLGTNLMLFIDRKVVTGKVEHVHKVEDIDLEDRIRQIRERKLKGNVISVKTVKSETVVIPPEDF